MSTPTASTKKPRPEFRNIHITQILGYRLPMAGIVSILHRVSGVLLFLALPLLLWMFELSLTSELSYERLRRFAGSILVKLVLVALAWAFLHHLVAGIRFLVLDLHVGVDKQASASSARAVLGVSLLLAAAAALKIFGVF